jgi:hypothetical protein
VKHEKIFMNISTLKWSFVTNHALVLTVISEQPESTGLEIAQAVGITERAARKIIADLHEAGYLEAERIGRRNRYRVQIHRPLARPLRGGGDGALTVDEFLRLLQRNASPHPAS